MARGAARPGERRVERLIPRGEYIAREHHGELVMNGYFLKMNSHRIILFGHRAERPHRAALIMQVPDTAGEFTARFIHQRSFRRRASRNPGVSRRD